MVVWVGILMAGCGGTGGGGSDAEPGDPFAFTEEVKRATLTLVPDPGDLNTPTNQFTLTATLLDPQGRGFPDQLITFAAELPDATIIPGSDNTGAVLTNDDGKAVVTLIAGLTTGKMRVSAEAFGLNTAAAITVTLQEGFISLGPLGIIPASVIFVNPAQSPSPFNFQAVGGTPPYSWANSNKSLGSITPQGVPNVNEQGNYTFADPLPNTEEPDTVTLLDAEGSQAIATVEVIFAECDLTVSPEDITFGAAVGGEQAQITIVAGVRDFTATQTFPDSGSLSIDQDAGIVTFTVATPPVGVDPDTILIRDSRGCAATVEVTITPAEGVVPPGGVPGGPGTPTSIAFVSAVPTTIGVRGSGLPEQSLLTFLITDANGMAVPGASVDFSISPDSLGGESLSPTTSTTDSDGMVVTTLTSGTRATTVQVVASLTTNSSVFARSTPVTIFGAPPVQGSFSLEALPLNIAGQVTFGLTSTITAFIGDRFDNPVPPGTAVSFTSNGGLVSGQGLTDDLGQATATLVSQNPIPDDDPGVDDGIPTGEPDGVVTVLGFTIGEEPFTDVNGNGVLDAGEPIEDDTIPEPFIDENLNGVFDSDNPFELFIDTNNNGVWDTAQGTQGVWDSTIFVWDTIPITFSAHTIVEVDCGTVIGTTSSCTEGIPAPSSFAVANGGSVGLIVTVRDPDFNPVVGGSTVAMSATAGTPTPASFTVPDASSFGGIVPGLNRFTFTLADGQPGESEAAENSVVTVTITSSNGDRIVSFTGTVD
jgi:hypothetical protein